MSNLRPVSHPGQSEGLVHFTGRARESFAPEVALMSPEERLDNIVWEQALRGHPVPGSDEPVVCLSESNKLGAAALLSAAGFSGWGLVLRRQWVWDRGGGPVWYVRNDLWSDVRKTLDPALHGWLVRTDPSTSDWLHEREWRVPCTNGELELAPEAVMAFLVSDDRWEPPTQSGHVLDPMTGNLVVGEVTLEWALGIPVWRWNGQDLVELGPVRRREEAWPVQP
ncbi:hypothetical protein [Nocardioides sp. NPDC006273]|uniref:hypothetical protein n=1 Tax=Nocardioides sp. NPDC006273 TaxID=3155598 RepID=UPI0033BD1598